MTWTLETRAERGAARQRILEDGASLRFHLALWGAVGAAVRERASTRALWLSTAGMGVPWLHVRLDARPKYYRFAAYREQSA